MSAGGSALPGSSPLPYSTRPNASKPIFRAGARHGLFSGCTRPIVGRLRFPSLRREGLAMAESRQAWLCSFGLSKRFCKISRFKTKVEEGA